jgi:hypothetical protein
MKKTFAELREQRMAANEKLGDIYVKAANRELNDEEKMQVLNLTREIEECEREMRGINLDVTNQEAQKSRREVEKKAAFREVLEKLRTGAEREILLNAAAGNVSANIAASGAIELTVHDLIPTLHEGLDLPKGLRTVTGVEGNEVWPVSVNDVEMEEVGEVEALSDQVLDFNKITPTPNRIGLTVPVSNAAIDNAAFDVLAFVQMKFGIALRTYLAKKIYSLADWTKNRGPFSGKKASAGTIELGANAYKNILAKVAEFSNKGFFEGDVCLCMDRVTEAELKATPKVAGAAAGFVIEGGLCAGYPYVVSHFVNTELNSADELVPTADRYLEVGYYEWFALQQHGVVRMSADSTSQAVAKKNITAITLNSFWSMTDLSVYINGANGSQAFGLYKIVEPEPTQA